MSDVPVKKGKKQAGKAVAQRREMEDLFQDFFSRRWPRAWSRDWPALESAFEKKSPRVDVVDREHEILVRAELPGMTKDDIEVSVSDNSLNLKASTSHEEETEDGDYFRREISSSFISRSVPLPGKVHGDDARATLRDGMLEVVIPKADESKRKRIEVQS